MGHMLRATSYAAMLAPYFLPLARLSMRKMIVVFVHRIDADPRIEHPIQDHTVSNVCRGIDVVGCQRGGPETLHRRLVDQPPDVCLLSQNYCSGLSSAPAPATHDHVRGMLNGASLLFHAGCFTVNNKNLLLEFRCSPGRQSRSARVVFPDLIV